MIIAFKLKVTKLNNMGFSNAIHYNAAVRVQIKIFGFGQAS